CRRVSRIRETSLAGLFLAPVQGGEILLVHHHFTPNLDSLGGVAQKPEGERSNGAEVGGHVLPDLAVAPRGAGCKATALIDEFNGKAIEFWLAVQGDGLVLLDMPSIHQSLSNTPIPSLGLVFVEDIG